MSHSNLEEILKERESRYGSFEGHAAITQTIKDVMRKSPNWDLMDDPMKEGLEMIAHKIGRILNGDPYYLDSWVDIGGYNKLVIESIEAFLEEEAALKDKWRAVHKIDPLTDSEEIILTWEED